MEKITMRIFSLAALVAMATISANANILTTPVGKLLSPPVSVRAQNSTVQDVLVGFREGVDMSVIVDEDQRVCGILGPSDVGRLVEAFIKNPNTPVTDVMTPNPYWAYESESI